MSAIRNLYVKYIYTGAKIRAEINKKISTHFYLSELYAILDLGLEGELTVRRGDNLCRYLF